LNHDSQDERIARMREGQDTRLNQDLQDARMLRMREGTMPYPENPKIPRILIQTMFSSPV
jgi:hypothetical protein